jgi:dihydropteroate synthase
MPFTLKAGARQIDLSRPVCMGILNTTPDSFSDGAQLARAGSERFAVDVDLALARAEAMLGEGAVFVDIGGESTRPGAEPVSVGEELNRVIPVVEAIQRNLDICISVDTSNPTVMREAVAAGAELINDVRALTRDDALQAAAASKAAICLMHMQGQPQTMQQNVSYSDVVAEVRDTLQQRIKACLDAGIENNRLLVDPGFGFGKTVQHNFQLLKQLPSLQSLGLPLLVGMSRKSMIGAATGRDLDQRLAGSVAAASLALHNGAHVIRSHDVAATMDAIRVHCAYQDA